MRAALQQGLLDQMEGQAVVEVEILLYQNQEVQEILQTHHHLREIMAGQME